MTTNYTHILNAHIDQIPGFDYPANMVELDNGDVVPAFAIWWDGEPFDEEEPDEEPTCFIDGQPVSEGEFLSHIRETLRKLRDQYGTDSEEFREEWSFYSDVHKDIYGVRPHSFPW